MRAENSIKYLFISQTRQKLIHQFFYSPHELFYVRQLVRQIGEEINSVRRELKNLANANLILPEKRGNRLYYAVNHQHPLFTDLLVLAHKTFGLGAELAAKKDKIGKIKLLLYGHHFLLGSPNHSGSVDFIIVGDINLKAVEDRIKKEEKRLGRELNYMIMAKSEFRLRKSKRDPFLVDFFLNSPSVIIGSPLDITNL